MNRILAVISILSLLAFQAYALEESDLRDTEAGTATFSSHRVGDRLTDDKNQDEIREEARRIMGGIPGSEAVLHKDSKAESQR